MVTLINASKHNVYLFTTVQCMLHDCIELVGMKEEHSHNKLE